MEEKTFMFPEGDLDGRSEVTDKITEGIHIIQDSILQNVYQVMGKVEGGANGYYPTRPEDSGMLLCLQELFNNIYDAIYKRRKHEGNDSIGGFKVEWEVDENENTLTLYVQDTGIGDTQTGLSLEDLPGLMGKSGKGEEYLKQFSEEYERSSTQNGSKMKIKFKLEKS